MSLSQKPKRGRKRFVIGGLLLVAAFLLVANTFIELEGGREWPGQFTVPGTYETHLAQPGRYYLWNNFETVFAGESIKRPSMLPDSLIIRVLHKDGGEATFTRSGQVGRSIGANRQKSVGHFEIDQAQTVKVEVTGTADTDFVLSLSSGRIKDALWEALGGLAYAALSGIVGFILLLWGLIRR